ncbi:ParA family protein [Natrinema salsiterrestre]|uniref:ParA family protein n=1 Tax=Natrinema salsiterrestre TaxID=2950540 RepID=A0A9Q4L708_9EURY|nr:ParA family protein [Natrinema salsiterrestre]MDF9748429.1 ParA family protein [Natrinema salsiterrestre]
MLAYSVYGEAGGPGKTTISGSLAAAHARHDLDVLAIDLDPQNASLSYLLDVDDDREDPDVDHLVRHLIDRPKGSFEDLIRTTDHGIDIIPAHNALSGLDDLLDRVAKTANDMGEDFDPTTRLREVLVEFGVADRYDVVIIDPSRTEGAGLYNAIAATGSLVVPAEATAKGKQSVIGLEQLVGGLEEELGGIDVGVLAVVPNKVDKRSGTQRTYLQDLQEVAYPVPVEIPIRGALFDGAWEHRCSPYEFVEEHRERVPDRERETLELIDELAATIEAEADL